MVHLGVEKLPARARADASRFNVQVPAVRKSRAAPHLLLLITEDWYYWSHRRSIARAAREEGFRVTLASRFGTLRDAIEKDGVTTQPIRLRRQGRGPFGEMQAIADLVQQYRRLRPDIVHHVSIKPVLYGSWASRLAGIDGVVNAISGLGYAFTGSDRRAQLYGRLAQAAYRSGLRRSGTYTIFQNEDDRRYFVARGLVAVDQTVLIRGSGVDLDVYSPRPEPAGVPVVLYAGRMLWSKGVGDLVAAVPILRRRGMTFKVVLIGHSDSDNPEAISPEQLRAWESEGLVAWLGRRDDVADIMSTSHIVVLTSDREGVPKVLLEAAAAGKPIVATDVAGCREVVDPGRNGFLVPVRSPGALADALGTLINDSGLRARMGAESRRKAEAEFSEERIVGETLALYDRILSAPSRRARTSWPLETKG